MSSILLRTLITSRVSPLLDNFLTPAAISLSGRAQNNSFITPGDAQVRFVGETAVLECNVSLVVSTAEVFEVQWMSQFGTSLNLDRIVFTQNNQTLIIANVTLADSQLYRCAIQAPSTGDTFILLYRLNVLGELCRTAAAKLVIA